MLCDVAVVALDPFREVPGFERNRLRGSEGIEQDDRAKQFSHAESPGAGMFSEFCDNFPIAESPASIEGAARDSFHA